MFVGPFDEQVGVEGGRYSFSDSELRSSWEGSVVLSSQRVEEGVLDALVDRSDRILGELMLNQMEMREMACERDESLGLYKVYAGELGSKVVGPIETV